jgi:molybdopterin synthase catalytic subunit
MTAARVTGSAVVMNVGVVLAVHQVVMRTLTGQQGHDETARRIAWHWRQDVMIVGGVHHHRVGDVGRGDRVRPIVVSPASSKETIINTNQTIDRL